MAMYMYVIYMMCHRGCYTFSSYLKYINQCIVIVILQLIYRSWPVTVHLLCYDWLDISGCHLFHVGFFALYETTLICSFTFSKVLLHHYVTCC